MISVLIPAFNEADNSYFWDTIHLVQELKRNGVQIEVLVGVTQGQDNTLERLVALGVSTRVVQTMNRGERYNEVLKDCNAGENDWILLNHPRSLLQKEAILELALLHDSIKWGAFTHKFDINHPLLSFTSWWSNYVRGDLKKIFYLDHCLFIRRSLLEQVGGVPVVEIFEDTILSQKLSDISHPIRIRWTSTTSAIRFIKKGFWAQAYRNQILKIQFLLGKSDKKMNDSYEKDINLNR
jgi:cellulose synthase/poly-beta-1,6-N-acetylglucosamine synthase-like glycosyltransferase